MLQSFPLYMQPLTLAGAAASPGYALQVAEDHKMASHFEACRAVGVDFVPVVVESLGRLVGC